MNIEDLVNYYNTHELDTDAMANDAYKLLARLKTRPNLTDLLATNFDKNTVKDYRLSYPHKNFSDIQSIDDASNFTGEMYNNVISGVQSSIPHVKKQVTPEDILRSGMDPAIARQLILQLFPKQPQKPTYADSLIDTLKSLIGDNNGR